MANLGPPAPPTRVGDPVGFTRTTRDGRRLHYELKVLQQPERARACGSGPKCELQYPIPYFIRNAPHYRPILTRNF